jgi:hypothetical protein
MAPLAAYSQTKLGMGILMLQAMPLVAGGDKGVFMAFTSTAILCAR